MEAFPFTEAGATGIGANREALLSDTQRSIAHNGEGKPWIFLYEKTVPNLKFSTVMDPKQKTAPLQKVR